MDFDQNLGELQRKVAQSQEGVGRRKLIYESLGVELGQSILNLGCGGGYQVRSLALAVGSEGRVVGVDSRLKQIEVAREFCSDLDNVELKQHSGTDLSFQDGTLDFPYKFPPSVHLHIKQKALGSIFLIMCLPSPRDTIFGWSSLKIAMPAFRSSFRNFKELILSPAP